MSVSLTKGGNLSLTKTRPGLTAVTVGLGWDVGGGAAAYDLDATAFLLTADGRVRSDEDMIFYNNPEGAGGAVRHRGDNRSGAGAGDDESVTIALDRLPGAVERIAFAVTIHEADSRGQSFGQVRHAWVRLLDSASGQEIARYDLDSGSTSSETALIFGELYHRNGEWKFKAVGQGYAGGLGALARGFGVDIGDAAPAAPVPAPAAPPPPKPVSLGKVVLTKPEERHRLSLVKHDPILTVTAHWTDNGDKSANNDDLDLRAGILLPDGGMFWLASSHPGSFDAPPFSKHSGDVRQVAPGQTATESIEVRADLSRQAGGKVAMIFSVYSAIQNGAVSIASLKPRMSIRYGAQVVECAFDFAPSPAGKADNIYTYVIGVVTFDGDTVEISPSGMVSEKNSENTPWLTWEGGRAVASMKGPAVFKNGKGAGMFGKMLGMGGKDGRKYLNV